MTPADELSAAAEKIRNTAEGTTPGPWTADHREYPEIIYGGKGMTAVVSGSRWNGEASIFENNDDAYHIALWHPGIAALVADLLDTAAMDAKSGDVPTPYLWERLLLLARAINEAKVA